MVHLTNLGGGECGQAMVLGSFQGHHSRTRAYCVT